MALVRPSTPDNPGNHYIYVCEERGVPGLMVDFKFYPLEHLRSLVCFSLRLNKTLPWNNYVNKIVANWVIAQIKC